MAQGDFGVVPNVWRPQFVSPINTGEDTQAGIPGNSAANLGATETTITESFFNVPSVGWQKIKEGPALSTITAVAYTTMASFQLFTDTPRTLIIVQYKGNVGLANLSFRFSATTPYNGTFGTVTSVSVNNQVGLYSVLLSPMANLTYETAAAGTGLARVYSTISYDTGVVADLTANNVQVIPQTSLVINAVNDGAGRDSSFATNLSGDIDKLIPMTMEAKVTAGSALILRFGVWKLGDALLSLTA